MKSTLNSTVGKVLIALGVGSMVMAMLTVLLAVGRDAADTMQALGIVLVSLGLVLFGIREHLDASRTYLIIQLKIVSVILISTGILINVIAFLIDVLS